MNFILNIQKSACSSLSVKAQSTLCYKYISTTSVKESKKKVDPFFLTFNKKGEPVRVKKEPGLKTQTPFDKRFVISTKDIAPHKLGGNKKLASIMGKDTRRFPHPPGYYDKKERFVFVPEMVPEFVVPDLKDFNLKPYVSYRAGDNIKNSKFTAQDLFKETYGKELVQKIKSGNVGDLDQYVEEFTNKQKEHN